MIEELVKYLENYYGSNSDVKKADLVNHVATELGFIKKRSVYIARDREYAVRFSFVAGKTGFSNTVLGLSTLLEYDDIPFVVCVLRPSTCELLLANTSCLSKISHSSHALTETNIKGSFLGHDILKEVGGLPNAPKYFDELFSVHKAISKETNIQRLVKSTASIVAVKSKFGVTSSVRQKIIESVRLSCSEGVKSSLDEIKKELDVKIEAQNENLLQIAKNYIGNVNLRGNKIEQLITGSTNKHGFFDDTFTFNGVRIGIDIKTSIAGLSSNPKNSNVDKLLEELSDGNTLSFLYVIYIDVANNRIHTHLINNFDTQIIDATRVQFHWAGRGSRGVTQLDSSLHRLFGSNWQPKVSEERAVEFVESLIEIGERDE